MSRALTLPERLARNAASQQRAYADLADALTRGDRSARERAQAKIADLIADYQRLSDSLKFDELEQRQSAAPRSRKPAKPLRELALDALDDIGASAPPALIADFTAALTGTRPSPSRFASLKRDEENAARRNIDARPAWIVPAISAANLTAIPRLLTSSSWPLERRIIGSRSMRADNLRIAMSLSERLDQLREVGAQEARNMQRLMFPMARAIPGASEAGLDIDTDRLRRAASAELALIEEMDSEERKAAATKLSRDSVFHRLWGRPPLLDTEAAEKAIR
ncbi:hypothetical protein [Roseovarius sp. C03]|uniref:hypothetical protein n=1 Tax=Roseovarius sp. C03 TaxID=3449222 RepID=UPI003EDBF6E6